MRGLLGLRGMGAVGVRGRITLLATVVVLIVLAGTGAALSAVQRSVLTDSVDEVLQRQISEIVAQIDAGTLPPILAGQGDDESYGQVTDAAGRIVAATRVTPPAGSAADRAGHAAEGPPDFRVRTAQRAGLRIDVGTPLDDVNESVAALVSGLLVAVPAAAALLAVMVWFLVGRVLRPVERIRQEVAEISGRTLERRVPEPPRADEIGRLARTMNGMLARLDASAKRQQRFVSDASHELRSPLARIRAELEVDEAHPGLTDPETIRRSVLAETLLLQHLVDDLLELARIDEADLGPPHMIVDLDEIVRGEIDRARASARLTVTVTTLTRVHVRGDAAQLGRVVRNLLDNAAEHGGGQATVGLVAQATDAVLTVSDAGPGIESSLQEQVFERFARADAARSGSGFGLGLAISRALVTGHGGTIRLLDRTPGAHIEVRLPLEPDRERGETSGGRTGR
ncbi:HAMP domain-containing histidine kinase [Cryobacterium frigoriphilum]|uniref:histidine kinase n=1 Tax=Cryobacterium frigoriphilum TaxID=1259150 RepID=A0A4R8ZTW3_9MICO|nr:HAMP domain-containing sensor histidine kinase [Cryobacterium frigoriphilum]TFD45668.1 HAMP domain-containing histidine kinase [Cryobacterium frigoriphilum]